MTRMSSSSDQAYSDLIRRVREAAFLGSCAGVLGWDERTYLPKRGTPLRGDQMGLLARLGHQMSTDPAIGDLLAKVHGTTLVADPESDAAVNVREIRRSDDRADKVPKELVEELARVTTRAQGEWAEARKTKDFGHFRPWLTQIVALKRQEADAIGYTTSRYDALLDEYEPGATAAEITQLFAALAKDLIPLVQRITTSGRTPKRDILTREFPTDKQEAFGRAVAAAIGFDFDSGRLDTTTHPFCSGIGPGDCRITTRYNPRSFNESFFGTLHESGHAIYD